MKYKITHLNRFSLSVLLLLSYIINLTTTAVAAPSATLLPEWNISDENNTQKLDHSLWQTVVNDYVVKGPDGINLVDYAKLKKERVNLDQYISDLSLIDPKKLSKAEQFPYWVNLYNAATVQLIVDNYPVKSIRKITDGFFSSGPWDRKWIKVAGNTISLNNIEHGILRPIWEDNRIHYAVNCASIGCPNLGKTAMTSDNKEAVLDDLATDFINHPRGIKIDIENQKIQYSSIFHWYKVDFDDSFSNLVTHWMKYAKEPLATELAALIKIDGVNEKHAYNWDLNKQ